MHSQKKCAYFIPFGGFSQIFCMDFYNFVMPNLTKCRAYLLCISLIMIIIFLYSGMVFLCVDRLVLWRLVNWLWRNFWYKWCILYDRAIALQGLTYNCIRNGAIALFCTVFFAKNSQKSVKMLNAICLIAILLILETMP